MAQVILSVEPDEILRAFTTGAKNEGFRLLLRKGLKAISSPEQGGMGVQGERTDSRYNVRRMSQADSP